MSCESGRPLCQSHITPGHTVCQSHDTISRIFMKCYITVVPIASLPCNRKVGANKDVGLAKRMAKMPHKNRQ